MQLWCRTPDYRERSIAAASSKYGTSRKRVYGACSCSMPTPYPAGHISYNVPSNHIDSNIERAVPRELGFAEPILIGVEICIQVQGLRYRHTKRRCSDTDNDVDRCSVAVWSLESCHTDSSPATNDPEVPELYPTRQYNGASTTISSTTYRITTTSTVKTTAVSTIPRRNISTLSPTTEIPAEVTSRSTPSSSQLPAIGIESCEAIVAREIMWFKTRQGQTAKQPCPLGGLLLKSQETAANIARELSEHTRSRLNAGDITYSVRAMDQLVDLLDVQLRNLTPGGKDSAARSLNKIYRF
ncbi:unnamed protein product [Ranitomeya imitator]|uniref:AGRL2-4 GAIN subdomain A domain-containing protein n=1 Tax=Ranitomeya imitator TaxID=111125 RepID=A0ABN9LGX7_9NEOB|nr:unnamed protein product [Ranitomeya imitator]